ncbi:MAG: hypothetical protein A4S09_09465 [Proteobacteria bacterium SG_bin7]|nr:MAG: hypothetical protein A4S09_09465 [Proteobacteria bacterium SG_bin7]
MNSSNRRFVLIISSILVSSVAATIIYTLIRSTTIQKDLESRYNFTQLKTEVAQALASSANCTASFSELKISGEREFISAPLYYDDGAGNKRNTAKIIEVNDLIDALVVKKAGIEVGNALGKEKYKGKYVIELSSSIPNEAPMRAEFSLVLSVKSDGKIGTCVSTNLASNIGFCPPRNMPREMIGTWKRKQTGGQFETNGNPFAKLTKAYFCPAKTVLLTAQFNCHYKWRWEYQDNNKSPIYNSHESFFAAIIQPLDASTLLVSCEVPRDTIDECVGPIAPYNDSQSYASSCRLFQSYADGVLTCCPTGE